MYWVIQCQVVAEQDGWSCSHQVPTFNLMPAMVGVDIGQVRKIACRIVDPARVAKEIHVSMELV